MQLGIRYELLSKMTATDGRSQPMGHSTSKGKMEKNPWWQFGYRRRDERTTPKKIYWQLGVPSQSIA